MLVTSPRASEITGEKAGWTAQLLVYRVFAGTGRGLVVLCYREPDLIEERVPMGESAQGGIPLVIIPLQMVPPGVGVTPAGVEA